MLFFVIFISLHSLNLSFPLLSHFISTAISKFPPWFCMSTTLISCTFASPPRFQTKILSYFSLKVDTPFCYYCLTLAIKPLLTLSEMSSVISPNKNYLKVPKTYNLWSISNNYEWMKCYLRFMSKRSTTCPKLYFF